MAGERNKRDNWLTASVPLPFVALLISLKSVMTPTETEVKGFESLKYKNSHLNTISSVVLVHYFIRQQSCRGRE